MRIDAEIYLEQFRDHPRVTVAVGSAISLSTLAAMIPYFALGNPQRLFATASYYFGAAGLVYLAACGLALIWFGLRSARGV